VTSESHLRRDALKPEDAPQRGHVLRFQIAWALSKLDLLHMAESFKNSPELTRHVAKLARLRLTDQEVATFTQQIGDVLKYVDKLQEVNVEGIAPLSQPFEMETPMRDDKVVEPPKNAEGRPKVLDCAPDVLNDGYKVPPIL
jgi:aspartyl-tRNA(Asn)/glutamyl-tRNA(Gln) amidotransferase subunit C